MPFQEFTQIGSRNKEFISITENKTFGLSRNFLNTYHINSYHKAIIFYDADEKKIAINFSVFDPKNGLSVRVPDSRYGGTIVAKSFFDAMKIDTKLYAGRYDAFEEVSLRKLGIDGLGNAFVITLKEKELEIEDDKPIDLSQIPF